jgi:uncharacterized protein (DUF1778 family)
MPRPKTPKAKQRDQTIQVKATREQKRILIDKAKRANVSLSTWLLNAGLVMEAPPGPKP